MNIEYREWLSEHCNRLKNGQCHVASCLLEGGWDGKSTKEVDYDIATCTPFEMYQELHEVAEDLAFTQRYQSRAFLYCVVVTALAFLAMAISFI